MLIQLLARQVKFNSLSEVITNGFTFPETAVAGGEAHTSSARVTAASENVALIFWPVHIVSNNFVIFFVST